MSTTRRSRFLHSFMMTMLLGLVMAAGIYALAEPELAWLGFAMAGMYRASGPVSESCRARIRSRAAG